MDETRKARQFRLILIFLCISVTVFAFLYRQSNEITVQNDTVTPLYLVLEQSESKKDNPKVAIYNKKNQEPVLALYEVELDNKHKFTALEAATLKGIPEKLSNDESNVGLWVYINGKWIYLDESLEVSNKDQSFKKENPLFEIELTAEMEKVLKEKGIQDPISIHSLTADQTLWLVVQKNGSFRIVENLQV